MGGGGGQLGVLPIVFAVFLEFHGKNWEIAWHLQDIVQHYESTVKWLSSSVFALFWLS